MAGGVIYLLGSSYTYLQESHTRVDIIYSNCSPKTKAILDIVCGLIFFFPLIGVMFYMAVMWAIRAWRINEVMFNSFWYPPAAPYRTIFAIGLFLLLLQGVAKLIQNVYFLVEGKNLD